MDLSETRLDRLLAGKDRLSVREKEEILDTVLAKVAPAGPEPRQFPRFFPRWAFAALGLVIAVPAALLLARRGHDSEFTARGGAGGPDHSAGRPDRSAGRPALETSCIGAGGGAGTCALGDKLLFKVEPGRFRAFAAVALAPDGTTFWYFPNDVLPTSVDLSSSSRSGILEQAIALDPRHAPGDYVVYGVFSGRPLTREEVRSAIRGPGGPDIAVLERHLRIEERRKP